MKKSTGRREARREARAYRIKAGKEQAKRNEWRQKYAARGLNHN